RSRRQVDEPVPLPRPAAVVLQPAGAPPPDQGAPHRRRGRADWLARRRPRRSGPLMVDALVIPLLKVVIVLNATLVAVTYMVLLERKVIAWAQSRLGPMRVGPYGILQPVADAVKLMIKEDITPVKADRWVFTAAPIISMV